MKAGPRSLAGADPGPLCYGKGGTEPTITDAHLVLGRIPPHLLGGEIPLDVDAATAGIDELARRLGLDRERCANGVLGNLGVESGERPAPGHRQAWAGRPRVPYGDLRRLGIPAGVPVDGHPWIAGGARPAEPGERLRLWPAHRGRPQRLRADRGRLGIRHPAMWCRGGRRLGRGVRRADARSAPRQPCCARTSPPESEHVFERTADLRYFGQAFEVRVPVPGRRSEPRPARPRLGRRRRRRVPRRTSRVVRLRLSGQRRPTGRVGESPGGRGRSDPTPRDPRGCVRWSSRARPRRTMVSTARLDTTTRSVCFDAEQGYESDTLGTTSGPIWPPGIDGRADRRSSRSSAPPSRCTPVLRGHRRRLRQPADRPAP